jgi:hypothetical protein
VAADVRSEFLEDVLGHTYASTAAERFIAGHPDLISDTDDGPIIYLALAVLLAQQGITNHLIIDRARQIIKNKEGLGRWLDEGGVVLLRRQQLYDSIGMLLR